MSNLLYEELTYKIEIKAVSRLAPHHEAQLINYLKATGMKVGLLINFGEKLEFKRRVF